MMRLGIFVCSISAVVMLTVGFSAAQQKKNDNPVYDNPEAAAADPDFALQGEYTKEGQGLQIVALGDGQFKGKAFNGGLPGAGWDRKKPTEFEFDGESVKIVIEDYKKVERKSPTLGAKPPKDAVVLFDGSANSVLKHWNKGANTTDDGLLMQGVTSTDKFQDFSIHVEFRLPFQPKARGQGRGNSGLYYQGRFETQMLDSFGLEGKDNECGGLYTIKAPDVNMCLPPLSWQTYDADFRAARYAENGKKTENARITVRLNGVVIHNDVELPKSTTAAPVKEGPEPGPIYLQNHGNPVRYRNIWVVPRDYSNVSSRPIVPGFERFYTAPNADRAEGGRLLMSELNCTWCHKAKAEVAQLLTIKRAPILSKVGERIQPDYLLKFIRNPHGVKPGTTMPNLFTDVNDEDAKRMVEPIVHFLWATGQVNEAKLEPAAIAKGRILYNQVGCTVCHAPQEGGKSVPQGTTIPLVSLEEKYTVPSLTEFLKNPHAVRPSGRMPNMMLQNKEPDELANYLLRNADVPLGTPRFTYKAYHGNWEKLPDFDKLTPVSEGKIDDLQTNLAGKKDQFGLRFDGELNIKNDGDYKFHLHSDDGSRLFIDGEQVVVNDGIHAGQTKSGSAKLSKGIHKIRVEYFEAGGGEEFRLDIEGPKLRRRRIVSEMVEIDVPKPKPNPNEPKPFEFDPSQVQRGGELFALVGCADCHEMKINGELYNSEIRPKNLVDLRLGEGCLSKSPPSGVPNFNLTDIQRNALSAALTTPAPKEKPDHTTLIHKNMIAFNCYACHERGGIGGAEVARNDLFISTIPEMGDEGRLPPQLNGVADKLRDDYLKSVLQNGAKDRPYMKVRMPKFGGEVAKLTESFVAVDQKTEATIPPLPDSLSRVKAAGRKLVGGDALQCVKCHTFGNVKATGIQAIDLLTMTKRIREDWFHRYMVDPVKYRPGTRMPNVYPGGVSAYKDLYEGEPGKQNKAIWTYIADGSRAPIPFSLLPNPILLEAKTEPVIYRNFIEGVSPRGIAVGYPEKANIAYDANHFALRLVWHGPFIDASKHWRGRGQGNQIPLGDNVLKFEATSPVAVLESRDSEWPKSPPKERGYKFLGYSLDKNRRPVFRYEFAEAQIEDQITPVAEKGKDSRLQRQLVIDHKSDADATLFVRAAVGDKIEANSSGWYQVTIGQMKYQIHTEGVKPFQRESGGKQELLIEVPAGKSPQVIKQTIAW